MDQQTSTRGKRIFNLTWWLLAAGSSIWRQRATHIKILCRMNYLLQGTFGMWTTSIPILRKVAFWRRLIMRWSIPRTWTTVREWWTSMLPSSSCGTVTRCYILERLSFLISTLVLMASWSIVNTSCTTIIGRVVNSTLIRHNWRHFLILNIDRPFGSLSSHMNSLDRCVGAEQSYSRWYRLIGTWMII